MFASQIAVKANPVERYVTQGITNAKAIASKDTVITPDSSPKSVVSRLMRGIRMRGIVFQDLKAWNSNLSKG